MREVREHARSILDSDAAVVVKIGSSLLIGADGAPRVAWMRALAESLAALRSPVVLVSSGAIALGRTALGLTRRPATLDEAQACAAIGQIRLAGLWSEVWDGFGRTSAQMLLTVGDLEERARYLNARNTLETLLAHDVVPVVNENDTVATGEIRFGDNDVLSARVAQLAGAGLLLLLSDVEGLFDANPKQHRNARLIEQVDRVDSGIAGLAGGPEAVGVGTGGMISKIAAARVAIAAGCPVLLTSGQGEADPVARYLDNGRGTWFHCVDKPVTRRKQWLRGLQWQAGVLELDDGAVAALRRGASLLARGVRAVDGEFSRGDLVGLNGRDGAVGQGLAGYASDELKSVAGHHSDDFEKILGYAGRGAVVHRDDLIVFEQ